jgi:hypothetical protein
MTPANRNEIHTADPATAPPSPMRTKMPDPIMPPRPMRTADLSVMLFSELTRA